MTIADTFNHPSMLDLALRQELLPLECLRGGLDGLISGAPEIKFEPPPWDPPQVIAARNLVLIPPTLEELKLLTIS